MPSIALGSSEPDAIRLGEQQVNRIYLGRQVVWPSFDTPSGPRDCVVRLFHDPQELGSDQDDLDETYETVLCQQDVSQAGRTVLVGTGYSGDTWIGRNESGSSTAFIAHSGAPHVFPAQADGTFIGLWPWFAHASGGSVPTQFNLVARNDFLRVLGMLIPNMNSDFVANGYLVFGIDNGNILVLKASYGSATSDATFVVTADNLVANHTDLDILLEPDGAEGRVITSDMSRIFDANPADADDDLRQIHGIGFYDDLGPLMSVRWTPFGFPVNDSARLAQWAYQNQWTTYGTGETARMLFGVSSNGATEVYNSDTSVSSGEFLRGSTEIADGLVVSRIRYDSGNRRLIMNRTGSASFNGWATGDGAGKSLFVAARGNIMELPFVATSEYEGDANPNTETGGGGFFRWDLRTTTPGAIAMHQHLVDFLAGDGYQLLFVVADRGTVLAA